MTLPRALHISPEGALLAVILLGASLTPSLVPRSPELQGALGGAVGALGYGAWRAVQWLWLWLELPVAAPRIRRVLRGGLMLLALVVFPVLVWQAAIWQEAIRALWQAPPAGNSAPLRVAGIAIAVFATLILLGRLFVWLLRKASARSARFVPRRVANLLGFFFAVAVFATLFNGVLFKGVLRLVDVSSRAADALVAPELAPPDGPERTGSAASLVAWEDLGYWGRRFVASAPTADEIAAFWDAPARDPVRVYVGLTAAGDARDRARLAFEELKRAGGFEREILVIAVPTGSGWLDPGSQDSLEFMHRGDVATVAVQYSYLSSWVSVLVDPSHGLDEAQALFDLVYGHWITLPRDARPRLYLHGLSLGAFLSQSTVPLLDVLGDPFEGAMWAGSPFLSEFWRFVVQRREADSPAWRPRFGNDSLIRAGNQQGGLTEGRAAWGPIRLVFLQYASDPIVFFDTSLAFRRPDWLGDGRGPDVSPDMRWFPVITMLQVGLDMAVSLGVPGYGHDYVAEHYIPAWAETTDPEGWTADRQQALQVLFRDRPSR
ncbi:alpha/beta hydrolase [Thetidibacter halocola]|uniref:Alpha/beta-hydrolase family protein n=1 Tax=Thetidibacter halocola TaxID=2827239 RepID=A0A8J7WBG3_9RHOB|nr:alpha/beta-hydrolase family protein [Thetidibacter halocola]MBS0124480.1 alpha/beta-hydrolase family protein [Thetidibacter halocola]